jgi:hypothetical protein
MGDTFSFSAQGRGASLYGASPYPTNVNGTTRSSQGNGLTPTTSGVTAPNPFLGLTPTQRVGATETPGGLTGFDPTNPASAVANLNFNGAPANNINYAGGTFSLMA